MFGWVLRCCKPISSSHCLPQFAGIAVLVLLPIVHFGIINPLTTTWTGEELRVPDEWINPSVTLCRCNCSGEITKYDKSLYLRPSKITSRVLVISTLFCVMLLELVSRLVILYRSNHLRPHFALALFFSIHSLYKTYWTLITLYNDEFFYRFYHQMVHCVLHLAQTLILSHGCDARNKMTMLMMIVLLKTSIGRMLLVLKAQIDTYIWYGIQFKVYWVIPDLLFFLSDVMATVVCVEEIVALSRKHTIDLRQIFLTRRYVIGATIFFCFLLYIGEYFPEDLEQEMD